MRIAAAVNMASSSTSAEKNNAKPKRFQRYIAAYKEKFPWAAPCPSRGEKFAFCTACRCAVNISHGGRNDLADHEKTTKHKKNCEAEQSKAVKNTPSIASCFLEPTDYSVINAEVRTLRMISLFHYNRQIDE